MDVDHVIGRIGEPGDSPDPARWKGLWKKLRGIPIGDRKNIVTHPGGKWIERSRTEPDPGLVFTLYISQHISDRTAAESLAE